MVPLCQIVMLQLVLLPIRPAVNVSSRPAVCSWHCTGSARLNVRQHSKVRASQSFVLGIRCLIVVSLSTGVFNGSRQVGERCTCFFQHV